MASVTPTRGRTGQGSAETAGRRLWGRASGPWFRERRLLAAIVSGLLFATGWIVGLTWAGERDAATALFVLPVALLAVTFGRRGGFGAGIGAAAAVLLWGAHARDFRPGPDWAVVVALTALGVLLGEAVEDLVASERAARVTEANRWRAEQATRKLAEAADVNDKIVQTIAVAKWALESGETAQAIQMLDHAVGSGQLLVSSLLRDADAALDCPSGPPGRAVLGPAQHDEVGPVPVAHPSHGTTNSASTDPASSAPRPAATRQN